MTVAELCRPLQCSHVPGVPYRNTTGNRLGNSPRGLFREHSHSVPRTVGERRHLCPHGKRIELFARAQRPGWSVWGYEAGMPERRA
jgi:N6-adenosine-specific RNA methylase IME4